MSTSRENAGFSETLNNDPNAASTVEDSTVIGAGDTGSVPPGITQPAPSAASGQQAQEPPQAPKAEKTQRVRLSGERIADALPEGLTNIGMVSVMIPDIEVQKDGFEVTKDEAASLIAQFRQYKFETEKGTETPPVRI